MNMFRIYYCLFLCFILLGCEFKTTDNQQSIIKDIAKKIEHRNFKNDVIMEQDRYVYENKAFLIQAINNQLFIIDNQLNQVTQLDHQLGQVGKYLSSGEGPKEHLGVKRFFNMDEKTYLTFDHSQQLIRKFNETDSLLMFFKIKDGDWVNDMVHLKENLFLTTRAGDDYFKFVVFDGKKEEFIKEYSLESLLSPYFNQKEIDALPLDKNLIFEGYFASGSGGYIVYSCNKVGLFFAFDQNGIPKITGRTIDQLPLPKLTKNEISKGYWVYGLEPDLRGNYSRAINQDYVFILSNFLLTSYKNKRPIDVYDLETGNYILSFFLPNLEDGQMPDEISIYKNDLYVLYENGTIVKYIMKL